LIGVHGVRRDFACAGIGLGLDAHHVTHCAWVETFECTIVVARVIAEALVRQGEVFVAQVETLGE
jgi:hypothetical protein